MVWRSYSLRSRSLFLSSPVTPSTSALSSERNFAAQTARVLREVRPGQGTAILRRAAAGRTRQPLRRSARPPRWPVDARIEQAVGLGGLTRDEARRRQQENDRARDAHLRHLHGIDSERTHPYHLTLDSTVSAWQTCIELIVAAARSRLSAPSA